LIGYKIYTLTARTKNTPTILEQQRHGRSKETTAKKRKQQKFQAVGRCWLLGSPCGRCNCSTYKSATKGSFQEGPGLEERGGTDPTNPNWADLRSDLCQLLIIY